MTSDKKTHMCRFQNARVAAVGAILVATASCGSDSASGADATTPAAESTTSTETTPTEAPTSDTVDSPVTTAAVADPQASTPPATDGPADPDGVTTGPVIVSRPSDSAEEAGAEGTLSLQENCLFFNYSDVDEVSAVVWPDGTGWDASSESVLSTSGDSIPMGQLFSAGGGFHTTDTVGAFVTDPDGIAEVTRCVALGASEDAIFVIQSPVNL